MSDLHSRSTDDRHHAVKRSLRPADDGSAIDRSLTEFGAESLDLFPSEATEQVHSPPDHAILLLPSNEQSVFEYVLGPSITETADPPHPASPATRHSQTRTRLSIGAAAVRHSLGRVAADAATAFRRVGRSAVVACRRVADWAGSSSRSVGVYAAATLRQVRGMPRYRPLAATGMLALVVVAGTYDGFGDIGAGGTLEPVASVALPSAAVESPIVAPMMVTSIVPLEPLRPAFSPTRPAIVARPRPPISAAVNARRRTDTQAIQGVLNRYRDAVSILSVANLRAVWPSADVSAVRREFAGLVEQNLEFDGCRISSAGTRASASCAGVVESGFKARSRRPRSEKKQWQFSLRKVGNRWIITGMGSQSN